MREFFSGTGILNFWEERDNKLPAPWAPFQSWMVAAKQNDLQFQEKAGNVNLPRLIVHKLYVRLAPGMISLKRHEGISRGWSKGGSCKSGALVYGGSWGEKGI